MHQKPKLLIVPGIGDDTRIYQTFVRRWNRLGYDTRIIPFGWVDTHAPFAPKMAAFLQRLDEFRDEPLYIIGISAGGTAAINALAVRNNVKRVLTVCSPLRTMPGLRNPLLAASIKQVMATVEAFTPQQKQRILSIRAVYDQVVDTRLSQAPQVRSLRLFSIWHAPTIYVALMLYAPLLARFFRRR